MFSVELIRQRSWVLFLEFNAAWRKETDIQLIIASAVLPAGW